MPIRIDFLSNVRDFLRGTDDAEQALDDVAGSLDDAARDGDRSTERLERSFKDLAATARRAGDDAGDSIRTGIRSGTDGARRGLDDLKDESKQTARESAASFDGSAASIVDAFQEVAANAFIGFGPAGLVAGLTAAAGIGLISKAIEDANHQGEEHRQHVAEIAAEYIETGTVGSTSLQYIIDNLEALATKTEEGKTNLADLFKAVRTAGAGSFEAIAQAYAGQSDGLDEIIRQQERYLGQLQDKRTEDTITQELTEEGVKQLDRQITAQETVVNKLRESQTAAREAETAAAAYAASGAAELEQKAVLIDAVNDAYDDAAGSVEAFINKETGVFDVGAYITSMQQREEALRNYQTTLASSGLTPEAKGFLNEQGAEAAALMLAGYQSAAPEQQAELNRIWAEAGASNSGEYAAALEGGLKGRTVTGPNVEPQLPSGDSIITEMQRRMNGRRVVVHGVLRTAYGQEIV